MIDVLSLKLPSFLISNFPLKFSFICFPLFFWAFFLLLAKCIYPARTQCMRPFLHRLRTFLARFLSVPRSQIHLYLTTLKPVLSKCIWLQLPDLCIQPTYHASPFFSTSSLYKLSALRREVILPSTKLSSSIEMSGPAAPLLNSRIILFKWCVLSCLWNEHE